MSTTKKANDEKKVLDSQKDAIKKHQEEMKKFQAERLLKVASSEIKGLRKSNREMSLRLGMFDDVMSALHGQPARSSHVMGLGHPDITQEIDEFVKGAE